MRMRTVRTAHRELKEADPNCAVGLTTLYRLVSEGVIPSVPVGRGKILIDMDTLENFLSGKASAEVTQ